MPWEPELQWTEEEFEALKLCQSQLESLEIEKEAALRLALQRVLAVDISDNAKLFERPGEVNLQDKYMEKMMSMLDALAKAKGLFAEAEKHEESATETASGVYGTVGKEEEVLSAHNALSVDAPGKTATSKGAAVEISIKHPSDFDIPGFRRALFPFLAQWFSCEHRLYKCNTSELISEVGTDAVLSFCSQEQPL